MFNIGKKIKGLAEVDYERTSNLEKLRSQGSIAEEEYQQALSKEQ